MDFIIFKLHTKMIGNFLTKMLSQFWLASRSGSKVADFAASAQKDQQLLKQSANIGNRCSKNPFKVNRNLGQKPRLPQTFSICSYKL